MCAASSKIDNMFPYFFGVIAGAASNAGLHSEEQTLMGSDLAALQAPGHGASSPFCLRRPDPLFNGRQLSGQQFLN